MDIFSLTWPALLLGLKLTFLYYAAVAVLCGLFFSWLLRKQRPGSYYGEDAWLCRLLIVLFALGWPYVAYLLIDDDHH